MYNIDITAIELNYCNTENHDIIIILYFSMHMHCMGTGLNYSYNTTINI